jgi:hypothetical protein
MAVRDTVLCFTLPHYVTFKPSLAATYYHVTKTKTDVMHVPRGILELSTFLYLLLKTIELHMHKYIFLNTNLVECRVHTWESP